jgi:hypothetical protein
MEEESERKTDDTHVKGFLRWRDFALRRVEVGAFEEALAAMRLKKEELLEHMRELPESRVRFEEMADVLIESVEDSQKAGHSPADALKQYGEREHARMEADVLLLRIRRLERHGEEFFKIVPKHEEAVRKAFPKSWGDRIKRRLAEA